LWEKVMYVDCQECFSLDELPLWTGVMRVLCSKCYILTELPAWPNVTRVSCAYCISLISLPMWPKIEDVFDEGCVLFRTHIYALLDPTKQIYTSQLDTCCICMDTPKSVVMDPCYHLYTCKECSERVYNESRRCPVCTNYIKYLVNTADGNV